MPIGKNALKRVSNNGYSNVNTSAPDMENSEIVQTTAVVTEEKTAQKKVGRPAKKTQTKAEAKPTVKEENVAITPKTTSVKAKKNEAKKSEETSHPDGFIKVALGMDMPVYLL